MAGKLVHFEVPAQDASRALGFYQDLFGWKFQEYPGAPGGYHMTQFDDQTGGAIQGGGRGSGAILVYFDVDDIRAEAKRVGELGGQAEKPSPVPQMGWFARCKDTEGNDFGLWQSDESAPAPEGM
jgi:uncharacterized protein